MIDSKPKVQAILNAILPTQYELFLNSSTVFPCITYIESGDSEMFAGETLSYYSVGYTVKLWGKEAKDIKTISQKAIEVVAAMREKGFKLSGSNETTALNMICKILNFEAVAQEGSAAWY